MHSHADLGTTLLSALMNLRSVERHALTGQLQSYPKRLCPKPSALRIATHPRTDDRIPCSCPRWRATTHTARRAVVRASVDAP